VPILTYTPEGADPIVWDFDFDQLHGGEVAALEDASGLFFEQFKVAAMSGSWKARHALGWVLMKRTIPTLAFSSIQEWTPAQLPPPAWNLKEARDYVATYAAEPDDDDKTMIAHFFNQYGDAIYRTDEGGPDSPKD
jgi:hypothetical protein